jgi:hypothetical protein
MTQPAVVIFAWNGKDKAFQHIQWDATPAFEVVLFDYSGKAALPVIEQHTAAFNEGAAAVPSEIVIDQYISVATEFKGRLINEVYKHFSDNQSNPKQQTKPGTQHNPGNQIAPRNKDYRYIGFFDDDLAISISGINRLLEIATRENMDAFQAATDDKSYTSHAFTVQQPGIEWAPVDWVEIMCPFYRKEIFDAAHEFYANNISSYGLDNYAIPFFQKILGLTKTAVIHAVSVAHLKPVTNGDKKFSNGLRAREEGEIIRSEILHRIIQEHAGLFPLDFLKRVYEYRTFRYNKHKRDIKRWLGFKTT